MLVHEILEYTAGRLPHKTALIEDDTRLTFGETLAQVEAFSSYLATRGVTVGDRVALLLPNCIEFCIAYFAVMRAGAIVVPLNNRLAAKEFTYIVNDSRPRMLVLGYQYWETYQAFKDSLDEPPDLIYAGEERKEAAAFFRDLVTPQSTVPSSPKQAPVPVPKRHESALPTSPEPSEWSGPINIPEFLEGGPGETSLHKEFPPGRLSCDLSFDDPACIMYTSGTTGLPKGAVMSHRNIFCNARNAAVHMGYREADITLIVVPLFHVTGLNTQLVAFCYTGGTCVIMRSYNTAGMIGLLAAHKVTTMITVPTMYTLMLVNPALVTADLSALRALSYGGAPMALDTIKALYQRLNVELFNAYGLTETSSLTTTMPPCDTLRKGASVGLPVTGVQLRVVDPDGQDLPAGTVGELWVKGPNVVRSYWNKPEATEKNLGDGWLRTGDLARIDEEGFVYVVDRMKDMINRGGENIYCIEVESALLDHPEVLEAAVVPRPHSIFGEVVHAFVVPAPGARPTEDELIAHCEGLIADYKAPAGITMLDELPRNPGGKVVKTLLRRMVPGGDPPRRR